MGINEEEIAYPYSAVILGYGRMGRKLKSVFEENSYRVRVVDNDPSRLDFSRDNILKDLSFISKEEISDIIKNVDVVVLALPLSVVKSLFLLVGSVINSGAVLVETLSVKTQSASWIDCCPSDIEYIGINPLFDPGLEWKDRTLLVTEHRGGAQSKKILRVLGSTGASFVKVDAMSHDKLLARRQVAVHAVLIALGRLLIEEESSVPVEVGPPPYHMLLLPMARMLFGSAEMYAEIQTCNPYAVDIRNSLRQTLDFLDGTTKDIEKSIKEICQQFGMEIIPAKQACDSMFTSTILPTKNRSNICDL